MRKTLTLGLLAAAGVAACSSVDATGPDQAHAAVNAPKAPSPYPVDPQVHVVDPAHDARHPGSVPATVPNATAYARYAASLLGGRRVGADAASITGVVTAQAKASGVRPARALALFMRSASAEEQRAHARRVAEGARGVDPQAPLAALASRVADAEGQVATCTADGVSPRACCAALAVPWFLADAWASSGEAEHAALTARADALYDALPEVALARPQPFEHQGIKAWLSACAGVVGDVPGSLAELRARWGDYRTSPSWQVELHPISMAKQAARRIYRRRDAPVSIAESLDEACAVRETELVAARADGLLEFASYRPEGERVTHGFFPARPGADAVKYTPDACMGCHYRLDSREFDVRMPSYVALGLALRASGGAPLWVDGSACAKPGERVVWHERPAAPAGP